MWHGIIRLGGLFRPSVPILLARAEEWVSRGAHFVPRFRSEIDQARSGIRSLSEDSAKRFMKIMAPATTPEVLLDIFNTPTIRKMLKCTISGLKERITALQKQRAIERH